MKILKDKKEIQSTFNEKKYFASKYFTVFTSRSDGESQILVTPAKKFGNAVARNRVKRRVKDVVFNSEAANLIQNDKNYIFICKDNINNINDYKRLVEQVEFVLKGANKNGFKEKRKN